MLRFLASGKSQQSLSFTYRLGKSTVSNIIKKTCDDIYEKLAPIYLTTPSSQENWLKIANDLEELWNLPNVIGAPDCISLFNALLVLKRNSTAAKDFSV